MEIKWIFIPTLGLSSVNSHAEPSRRGWGWHKGDLCVVVCSWCGLLHRVPCLSPARLTWQGQAGAGAAVAAPQIDFFYFISRVNLPINKAARELREQQEKKNNPHNKSNLELRFVLSDHETPPQNQWQEKLQIRGEMHFFFFPQKSNQPQFLLFGCCQVYSQHAAWCLTRFRLLP